MEADHHGMKHERHVEGTTESKTITEVATDKAGATVVKYENGQRESHATAEEAPAGDEGGMMPGKTITAEVDNEVEAEVAADPTWTDFSIPGQKEMPKPNSLSRRVANASIQRWSWYR